MAAGSLSSGAAGAFGAIGAATIDALSSMWQNSMNRKAQKTANAQNYLLAQQQMEFQERMANTAHQREVKDLRAAGLNPILSATRGGAVTPSGSLAQMKASEGKMNTKALEAYTAYTQRKAQAQQEKLIEGQVNNLAVDSRLKGRDVGVRDEQIGLLKEQQRTERARRKGIEAQNAILAPDAIMATKDAALLGSEYGDIFYGISRGLNTAERVSRTGKALMDLKPKPQTPTKRAQQIRNYDRRGRETGSQTVEYYYD